MSPDTSDPERPADRGSAPDRPFDGRQGSHHPGPGGFAPPDGDRERPGWPAGVPVSAGTPVTAPGADPLPWQPFGAPHPGGPEAWPARPPRTAGARRRTVGVTLGAAFLLTVLGAPLGLLWALLAPDTPVVKTAEGAVYAQPQPEQPIAADGWFSLLGLGFGVLAAIALWFLLRRRRGPVGLLAGVLGGLGAALVAWQLGRRIGLATYQRLLETAPDGQPFSKPADLRAGGLEWFVVPYGDLLLPAFGAAVTYTLLAGWSRWPSLRPEPEPQGAWPQVGPAGVGLSWGPGERPARSAAPEPPGPGAAEPPRG